MNDAGRNLMEITRIAEPDGFMEKHVSLNGTFQEIIRTNKGTWCYFPDVKKGFYKEGGIPSFRSPDFDPSSIEQYKKYYQVKIPKSERMIGREVDRITFQPKDHVRFGQDLWVDQQTGLLLRSDLVDHEFNIIDSRMFVELILADRTELKIQNPIYTGEDYIWNFDQFGLDKSPVEYSSWTVGWVPDGFRKVEHTQTWDKSEGLEVEQIVFSDSLSNVSVFVRKGMEQDSEFVTGLNQLGSVNAYSRIIGPFNVTTIGEVPEMTVRGIGDSVVYAH